MRIRLSQNQRNGTFQLSMLDTLFQNQPYCLLTYLFPCCFAYYLRYRVLDSDLSRYSCCQGYMDMLCFRAGMCNEQACPSFCLFLEACLCLGPSVSTSRLFVMDQYDLRPDPCDNQMIRFTNCLAILSCFCDIASIFHRDLRHLAHTIDLVAKCVFYSTIGCMVSQVFRELDYRRDTTEYNSMPTEEARVVSPIYEEALIIKDEKGISV